jgi:hypothetical protein
VTEDQGQQPTEQPPELEPLAVDTVKIVVAGTALFAVALVVTLLVPALHSGGRDWWPWACVSGFGLGLVGLTYIHRGRGNAASARRRAAGQASSTATPSDVRDTSTST